jgi:hypothetical protein
MKPGEVMVEDEQFFKQNTKRLNGIAADALRHEAAHEFTGSRQCHGGTPSYRAGKRELG